jgi:hypothetical protein
MTKKSKVIIYSITLLLLSSCFNSESQVKEQTITDNSEDSVQIEYIIETNDQRKELQIFNYHTYRKSSGKTVGFVSMSEIDRLSEHPDSIAVPKTNAEYFILNQEYRKRFLRRTGILETDTVFIYNYHKSTLSKIAVQKLNVAAFPSGYDVGDYDYTPQWDYHIGFEIDHALIKDEEYNFVYVGRQNPFVIGMLHPLKWEKIELDKFPSVTINLEEEEKIKGFKETGAYKYISPDYEYFIKEFISDEFSLTRQLVVKSIKTKKTVSVKFFHTMDFVDNLPLNGFGETVTQNEYFYQFTGQLFKNKPPVFFGFTSHSAGCPYIYFIGDGEKKIEILCDNRH